MADLALAVLLGASLLGTGFGAGWMRCAWVHDVSLARYFKPRRPKRPTIRLVPPQSEVDHG